MKTFFGSSFLLSDFALRGVWSRHHSLHKVAHRCQKSSSGHAPAHSQAQLGASVPFLLPTNHWTPQFNCIETNQLGSPDQDFISWTKADPLFLPTCSLRCHGWRLFTVMDKEDGHVCLQRESQKEERWS